MERSYNPGLGAKGKSGQNLKRYYTGKWKKGRRSKQSRQSGPNVSVGDRIIFKDEENFLTGMVKERLGEFTMVVTPSEDEEGTEKIIVPTDCPVLLSSLEVKNPTVMLDVLVLWNKDNSMFFTLVPGKIFQIEDSCAWVSVSTSHSTTGIKCQYDELCLNPYQSESTTVETNILHSSVSMDDVNVILTALTSAKEELAQMKSCYKDACLQITELKQESVCMNGNFGTLQAAYDNAVSKIGELENCLRNVQVNAGIRIKTLHSLIDAQRDSLNLCKSQLQTTRTELEKLKAQFQRQSIELERTKESLKHMRHKFNLELIKSKKLGSQNENLLQLNQSLTKELAVYKAKNISERSLEVMPTSSGAESDVLLVRTLGCKQRSTAWHPVPLAVVDSRDACQKTLENRAKVLSKVLHTLSSTREKASDEDVICTLSTYFRQNPHLLVSTCERNNLQIMKEITSADAVNLKVLLRLPMSRLRELRTFLKGLNIDILPNEKKIYTELTERNNSYDGRISVGTVMLKKTVAASEETEVTYVKVQSLEGHIHKAVHRHSTSATFTTDGNFSDKVWLKIGGDKGGSSTKLAMQVVNAGDCNSADRTELLGMFEATDTYVNMQTIFGSFTQEFIALQKDFFIQFGESKKMCEIFLFGDYEFLCKVLGHMGASASFPCIWCYMPRTSLANNQGPHSPMVRDETGEYIPNEDWPRNRTAQDLISDLANNKVDQRRDGDRRANGACHHSIAEDPILPIVTDIAHVIPPSLHIFLGLVVRYYKYVEMECRNLDHDSLGERDGALHLEWERLSLQAKTAELDHLQEQDNLKSEEDLLKNFQKSANNRGAPNNEPCSLPLCAIAGKDASNENVEWIQCTRCGKTEDTGWFHIECLGLLNDSVEEFTVCPVCHGEVQSKEDVIATQKERVTRARQSARQKKQISQKMKADLEEVYARVCQTRGPKESELNRVLEKDLHVQKQAYHSQCFVGNHCVKILQNHRVLLQVLSGSDKKQRLEDLFRRLASIFTFFKSRFLTHSEVLDLCHQCWDFGIWFPSAFPEERIPPKLHFLVAHIPECAQRWKTVGLLSEHGLESIHASLNREERTYASVREKHQRMRLVFSQHSQRIVADKSMLKVKRRKCLVQGCDGRFKGVDGVRKCQKCGSTDS